MTKTVDLGVEGLSPAVYVGAGGSANVFAARILETGQEVAVKLLRASADSDKERERFEREHETLSRLSTHDGIVPVIDAGVTDRNEPYFLMPLMEGSLQDRIDNEGALEWETASQLIAEISDTLDFAHANSVLHRDLKPGNILLDTAGVPRIADFGIAKLLDSNVSKSSKALGTPSFMPPERFKAVEATEASDVYGLGATLAALLTGTAPFLTGENDTDAAVMMRVMSEEPAPLSDAGIPGPIAAVVTRSMAKEPSERPGSAAEFASLLRTATIEAGGAASLGPVTVAIPRRDLTIPEFIPLAPSEDDEKKKPVLLLAAAAFVLLIGLGGAAFAFTQQGGDTTPLATGDDVTTTSIGTEVEGESLTADEGAGSTDGLPADASTEGSETGGDTDGDGDNAAIGDGQDGGTDDAGSNTGDGGDNGDDGTETGGTDDTGGESATGGGEEPVEIIPPEPDPADACFSVSKSSVEVGDAVSFTNCSSDATSYSWSFGDGTTSASASPSKSWSTAGSKTVRLTATGPGGTDTRTATVTVSDTPPPPVEPTACFSANPTSVETGEKVSLSNCSSDATSYSWSFGDGTTSASASPSKSWTTTGSKTVRLTATGPGGTDTATRTISVTAPTTPPEACFTASTTNIDAGDSVSFSNCSEHASSYAWNFGDGGTSSHTSPSHTFSSDGTFTVRLTATGDGGSDTATRTITVNKVNVIDPKLVPEHITCTTLGESEWSWSWSTLPAWVDDYVIEFSGGSTTSVGRQPAAYQTTRVVTRIIAVKDGNWSPANVPACPPYDAGGPDAPSGVSCRFSNFRYVDDLWTWTETWSWSDDPSVHHYEVVVNVNGSNTTLSSGRGTYTTDPSNGQPNSGRSVKQIIAIDEHGNRATRGVSPCGNEGGSGWENPT